MDDKIVSSIRIDRNIWWSLKRLALDRKKTLGCLIEEMVLKELKDVYKGD